MGGARLPPGIGAGGTPERALQGSARGRPSPAKATPATAPSSSVSGPADEGRPRGIGRRRPAWQSGIAPGQLLANSAARSAARRTSDRARGHAGSPSRRRARAGERGQSPPWRRESHPNRVATPTRRGQGNPVPTARRRPTHARPRAIRLARSFGPAPPMPMSRAPREPDLRGPGGVVRANRGSGDRAGPGGTRWPPYWPAVPGSSVAIIDSPR